MKYQYALSAGLLLLLLIGACAGQATVPASIPTPIPFTQTPRAIPTPTNTPIPPTKTAVELTLRVTDKLVNCRYGPGVVYSLVSELASGQFAHVIGRNEESTWWYIRDPGIPNGTCWVSAQVTEITGEANLLPLVDAPLITVTGISLRIEPIKIFVPCDQFPQAVFFEAEITANGPTLAVWRLESSTGYTSNENTVIFEEAATKPVNGVYRVYNPGDYWVQIHILKPNELVKQLKFPANCSP